MKIFTLLILLLTTGCLPDSFTKFDEDKPNKAPAIVESGGSGGTVPGAGTPVCSASAAECNPPTGVEMDDISIVIGQNTGGLSFTPSITGGVSGTENFLSWSLNTTLPAGMSFDPITGIISGEPTGYVNLPGVTLTAVHLPSGEARSTVFNLSSRHQLQSITYKQAVGQLLIVTLSNAVDMNNFDSDLDDDTIPNQVSPQSVISSNGAKGSIIFIDHGDDDSNPAVMHVQVTEGYFGVGDSLSANQSVYFEDPVTGADGAISDIVWAFQTGPDVTLEAVILDDFDTDEKAQIEYTKNIAIQETNKFSVSTDGTITIDGSAEVNLVQVTIQASSKLDPEGAENVTTSFKVQMKENTKTPKRITYIAMEQKLNDKLVLELTDTDEATLFNPDANPGNTYITSEDGKKASVLQQEANLIFLNVSASDNKVFKNLDALDNSPNFFVSEAIIGDSTIPFITHAFKVDTVTAQEIKPIIHPQLIELEGTCDGAASIDQAGCGGVWVSSTERETLSFASLPDINNIGVCTYTAALTPLTCLPSNNAEWYEETGKCIDKSIVAEAECSADSVNKKWEGLHYGICSDLNTALTKTECIDQPGAETWISDGVIRGNMYYPIADQQIGITVTNSNNETYAFQYKLSINSTPKVLSYNNMVVLPVNDVSKFKVGDFVTGNPDPTTETKDSTGAPFILSTIDCRDMDLSKLSGAFDANSSPKSLDDSFWYCPRGVVEDIVAEDGSKPAALIVKVLKGFFFNNMNLDNVQVFGLGQATTIIEDPIPFNITLETDNLTSADIEPGDTVGQNLVGVHPNYTDGTFGKIVFLNRTAAGEATLYVTYNDEESSGMFTTLSTGFGNEISIYNSYDPVITNVNVNQLYATSIFGITAGVGVGHDDDFSQFDDITYYGSSTNTASGVIMNKSSNNYDIEVHGGKFKRENALGSISDINPFKTSQYGRFDHSTTTRFDQIKQLNKYYLYRDQAVTIISNLEEGGTNASLMKYTVSPDLPTGLFLDAKNGHILGTPARKSAEQVYTITATTPFGNASYSLSIKVSEYFGIEYDLTTAEGNKPPESFLVHKTGQNNSRTPCRVTEDQMVNGETNNRDIIDIQCFVEAAEKDLFEHQLNFSVKFPNNVCSYFVEDPYAFWAFKPEQTVGKTVNIHEDSAAADGGIEPWTQTACSGLGDHRVYPSEALATGQIIALNGFTPNNPSPIEFDDNNGIDVLGSLEYYPNDASIRENLLSASRLDWQNATLSVEVEADVKDFLCKGNYISSSEGATTGPNCDAGKIKTNKYTWTYHDDWCLPPLNHPTLPYTPIKDVDSTTCINETGYCQEDNTLLTRVDCENAGPNTWFAGQPVDPFCTAVKAPESPDIDCGGTASSCMAGPAVTHEGIGADNVIGGQVVVSSISKNNNVDGIDASQQPSYLSARAQGQEFASTLTPLSTVFIANYFNASTPTGNMCANTYQCSLQDPDPAISNRFTEQGCLAAGGTWDLVIADPKDAYQADFEGIQKIAQGGYCSGNDLALTEGDCENAPGDGNDNTFWVATNPSSNEVQHAFHGARPFYSYSCLDGGGNTKARIRILVREWNKVYRLTDSVDRFNPDLENTVDVMDNTDPLLIPFNGRTTYDYYPDWDTTNLMPFMNHGAFSCEAPALGQDATGDSTPDERLDHMLRFPGFNAFF